MGVAAAFANDTLAQHPRPTARSTRSDRDAGPVERKALHRLAWMELIRLGAKLRCCGRYASKSYPGITGIAWGETGSDLLLAVLQDRAAVGAAGIGNVDVSGMPGPTADVLARRTVFGIWKDDRRAPS
jgi:hypothetical protein